MIDREALAVLANFIRLMIAKIEVHISNVRGWENCQTTIALARLHSRNICRAQLSSIMQDREPDWDPESVLRLVY